MTEYEELGNMSHAEGESQYFILHHAVQKDDGDELKLLVVFDASAKCHFGISQSVFIGWSKVATRNCWCLGQITNA